MSPPATIHGSAVLVGEIGILIRGASGSGKSTLLLDLLAADPQAVRLVADDRVILRAAGGRLLADVPGATAGLVEMRGVGLLSVPFVAPVVVRLVVDLELAEDCPRLPEADDAVVTLEGVALPRMFLPRGVGDGARRVKAAIAGIFAPLG